MLTDEQLEVLNTENVTSVSYGTTPDSSIAGTTISALGSTTITIPTISTISTSINYAGATVGGYSSAAWNGNSGYTYSTVVPTVNITKDGIDMASGTDLKIDGHSLKEFMKKMEQRLAILVPDPEKLEKFQALQKAYDHYKTMESLCFDEPKEEDK